MKQALQYAPLIEQLVDRSAQSTLSMLSIKNHALRKYLSSLFYKPLGEETNFLSDPVFEAAFGWKLASKTMQQLAEAENLLSPGVVRAMDNPPARLKAEYRFNKEWFPYEHQLEAWQQLIQPEPKSVVITSGTGSGKTECFLVPILNDLSLEASKNSAPLEGVRALFLYPLNALINSQKDRLEAWTSDFQGKVKFCLYNGATKRRPEPGDLKKSPCEIVDRINLRKTPPPILVTNATMLEYMLVRNEDAPILEKSKGLLRWIVLDEAHTYLGSQAAELSLLLRRVIHAFGVEAKDVRFIATSATIGSLDGREKLREFLASVAGIPSEHVTVIGGVREVPNLQAFDNNSLTLQEIEAIDKDHIVSNERFQALASNPTSKSIRQLITSRSATTLLDIETHLKSRGSKLESQDIIKWLDACSGVKRDTLRGEPEPFLPLRSHIFHRVTSGLWGCADSNCSQKKNTALDEGDWKFGAVYLEHRERCSCNAPVYELGSCKECGVFFLLAEHDAEFRLVQKKWDAVDEFSLLDEDEAGEQDEPSIANDESPDFCILTEVPIEGATHVFDIDVNTLKTSNPSNKSIKINGSIYSRVEDHRCPCCEARGYGAKPFFRRMILGAPFHLGTVIPTVLQFSPKGKSPLERPHQGQRIITFTDSRQGTARISIKLQQDSERNCIRSFVYHMLLQKKNHIKSPEVEELERDCGPLKKLIDLGYEVETNKIRLQEKELKIKELRDDPSISWQDVVDELSKHEKDVREWMHHYYKDLDRRVFGNRVSELAKMLLAREFSHRPKRANSLETMGLVTVIYPRLSLIKACPSVWTQRGATHDEWRAFLKICLDFFVRENTFVSLDNDLKRWIGARFFQKRLLGPGQIEHVSKRLKCWPQFNRKFEGSSRQSKLIRILEQALGLNLTLSSDQDVCDQILIEAWNALVHQSGLLSRENGQEFYLPFENMSFQLTKQAWICPVSGRFLDTTLKNITPYLPPKSMPENIRCGSAIALPQFSPTPVDTNTAFINQAQTWCKENSEVSNLRARGYWTDLHDRIVEKVNFYRVAEHSAQQKSKRLEEYVALFKDEKINVLSCSTTMEMGVDIGGISTVAMNNVPPHPANYLQRAGRAGRRGENRSLAITVCKNNVLEKTVFLNPKWAFETSINAPSVSLNSDAIVQRHINSMLLGFFLKRKNLASNDDPLGLTTGGFFLNTSDNELPLYKQFMNWCLRFSSDSTSEQVKGLESLKSRTTLEGTSLSLCLSSAQETLAFIADKWIQEHNALLQKLENLKNSEEPVAKALQFSLKRMKKEYLLSELARHAFLPGYGFPLNVVALDTTNIDEYIKSDDEKTQRREDNRFSARDMPSRDLSVALREFAPGSEIVLDGKVYKSRGLALTWKMPPDSEVREPQDVRLAWRCKSCGFSKTQRSRNKDEVVCQCGSQELLIKEYIQPDGFSVDFYEAPHNDISQQTFIPIQEPWINVPEMWKSLPNRDSGRFRVSRNGKIFLHSSGIDSLGYALCFGCGRAEHIPSDERIPQIFDKPHKSLRYKKKDDFCEGSTNQWLVKRSIHLGYEFQTDIFELQLRDVDGIFNNDTSIMYTIAVALRTALARQLGIDEDELGVDTYKTREGQKASSIVLYDTNSGGSGYASQAGSLLPELFRQVETILQCDCEKACQKCIMSYDIRHHIDNLNRNAALSFLRDIKLQDNLAVPEDFQVFGVDTSIENQPIMYSIQESLSKFNADQVRIYIGGNITSWNTAGAPFLESIFLWAAKGIDVTLCLADNLNSVLTEETKFCLLPFVGIPNISLQFVESEVLAVPFKLLAEVVFGGESVKSSIRWATPNSEALAFSEEWGASKEQYLLKSPIGQIKEFKAREISLHDLLPKNKHEVFVVGNELNGPIQSFGERFWGLVKNKHAGANDLLRETKITSVTYSDKYIVSPLSACLILQIIEGLKVHFAPDVKVHFKLQKTSEARPYAPTPSKTFHNWPQSNIRDRVLEGLMKSASLTGSISSSNTIAHYREMEIILNNKKRLILRLDQGVGYWREAAQNNASFDFDEVVTKQVAAIRKLDCSIVHQAFKTYLAVSIDAPN